MKKPVVILILILKAASFVAQNNIVPNGSFEDTISCPSSLAQNFTVKDWYNPSLYPTSTPDYFHSCHPQNGILSVPQNARGFQYPKDGEAYVGIFVYGIIGDSSREYIQVKLKSQLEAQKKYCLRFYISLSEYSVYGCDTIAALFTKTPIISGAHIFTSNKILYSNQYKNYNTIKWMEQYFEFTADGGEEYLTLGAFNNIVCDSINDYSSSIYNSFTSYYFIDDVSLYECEEDSIPTEPPPASDSLLHYKVPNVISPNGDGLNDAFVLESRGIKEVSVKVYNRWGEEVVSHKVSGINADVLSKTTLWDATHRGQPAPQGVYYYLIELSTKNGEVIIEKCTVTVL
jgi:gliding motility-associated-like protein